MQTVKSIALTTMIMLVAAFQLDAKGPEQSPEEQLRTKVSDLVAQADADYIRQNENEAGLEFIITPQNKIVVLEVHTHSEYLDEFIKERLNYHAIHIKGLRKMTPYMLNVTFRKRS